jgi:hypothetical protein
MASFLERLNDLGFERTRRALAALVMSVFVSMFLFIAIGAPPELAPLFLGLGLCYGVGFIGVVAEWFWARWYASGLCWSGVMVAVASLVMLGWTPVLVYYGIAHALVIALLAGRKMTERYDLQAAWRERYQMDDLGVARLRKTVTRAAASLPSLIVWALGPKEGQGLALAAGVGALTLALVGLRGVIRLRSWGVLALGGAALLTASLGQTFALSASCETCFSYASLSNGITAFAVACLAAAVVPFVGPMARFLKTRDPGRVPHPPR